MADVRRVILWVWAAIALLAVAYTNLFFFASEDAPGNLQDMRHGASTDFPSWTRIVVIPSTVEGPVRTVAEDPNSTQTVLDEPGDVLLVRRGEVPSPFLARALAWVVANATTNTTFDVPALGLQNVTHFTIPRIGFANASTGKWEYRTLEVNLSAYAHETGYIVKADHADAPMSFHRGAHNLTRPVTEAEASQKVVLILDGWMQILKIALSVLFALIPLALLIFTQAPRRAPVGFDAVSAVNNLRCHECGGTFPQDATFCFRCGANRRE